MRLDERRAVTLLHIFGGIIASRGGAGSLHGDRGKCRAALMCILTAFLVGCSLFGPNKPDQSGSVPQAKRNTVPVRIFAGENINQSQNGQPLALVVKLYVLQDVNAFRQAGFGTFLDDQEAQSALGADLIRDREILFVPSQKYLIKVPVLRSGEYLGVVALFHDPAPGRWRVAFRLTPKKTAPIIIGLNACAMTVTSGPVINPRQIALDRLADVRCPHSPH